MGAHRRMWGRDDLLAELKGLGLLRDRALERSFLRVRQEDFLPDVFAPLAYSDMPLPIHATPSPPTMPSPRCLIAALDLLEPAPGQRILIAGCRGGYVAGLADPGFLIARGRGVHDLAFVKLVHNAGETMQMTFNEAPSAVIAGGRDTEPMSAVDFGRLFAVEDLLVHAWEGRVTGHYDQHFRDIADETFAGGPLDLSAFDAREDPCKDAARRAFQAAYILQSAGELERAADAYERSIRLVPSAEAHTFHGWTLSFMGRYDDAIEACKRAIEVDAAFGNPYNDIGAYLIEIGRLDDAIPWLERATAAPRYCCYFYAHTNLARIYLQKGMREKARKCLLEALRVNPEYEPAQELLRRIDGHGGYHA